MVVRGIHQRANEALPAPAAGACQGLNQWANLFRIPPLAM
jgi:hypothetical protein